MRRAAVLIAALSVAAAGCGGDDDAAQAPPPATSTSEPAPSPAPPTSGANAFIGSIAVDPEDGTVMLGTGLGLFRVPPGASEAERVAGKLQGGTVSSNLVVRYAGPGELIASGHPEGGGLPENLGLIRSRDSGDTWEPVLELGKSDYHLLQVSGKRVVAVKAEETDIQVSPDIAAGRFEPRTPPEMPTDVAFDPQDPKRMVVATRQGTFTSDDEGRTWRPRDLIATEQLAWAKSDALYRADPGGVIKRSSDGGSSWQDAGNVGLPVNELAVDADGVLYASVAGGEVKTSSDGGKTWSRLVKLR